MNLVIKYTTPTPANTAQLANDTTALGNQGINFVGANCDLAMALTNPVAVNNSDKASIIGSVNNISDGTYVDKIIGVRLPATMDATTVNYLSVTMLNIGINKDIVGVETLGLTKVETANQAAFAKNQLLNNLSYSVSKGRLIVAVPTALANIAGSTLNLRITYKS